MEINVCVKHHFVPRGYLRPFAENGRLKKYHKVKDKLLYVICNCGISKVCTKDYLYSEELDIGKSQYMQKYESMFCYFCGIMLRANNIKNILDKHFIDMNTFVYHLFLRNFYIHDAFNYHKEFLSIQEYFDVIFGFDINNSRIFNELNRCSLYLIKNNTDIDFITSDIPLIILKKHNNFSFLLPITPKSCLYWVHENKQGIAKNVEINDTDFVELVNRLAYYNSHNDVYFSRNSKISCRDDFDFLEDCRKNKSQFEINIDEYDNESIIETIESANIEKLNKDNMLSEKVYELFCNAKQ